MWETIKCLINFYTKAKKGLWSRGSVGAFQSQLSFPLPWWWQLCLLSHYLEKNFPRKSLWTQQNRFSVSSRRPSTVCEVWSLTRTSSLPIHFPFTNHLRLKFLTMLWYHLTSGVSHVPIKHHWVQLFLNKSQDLICTRGKNSCESLWSDHCKCLGSLVCFRLLNSI